MQFKNLAVAITLAVVAVLVAPSAALARDAVATASAGWHGRAIEDPQQRPQLSSIALPPGWRAGPVARGTGYSTPDGSRRVRDLQRRLTQLGYRPGPVDGRFGPRTEAATRWFQFKHGLEHTGRADRATLTVLRARSEHKPLPTTDASQNPRGGEGEPAGADPLEVQEPGVPTVVADSGSGIDLGLIALAALTALVAGLLAGTLAPDAFRRRKQETGEEAQVLPFTATPVFGYVSVDSPLHADTALAAIVALCSRRGWNLAKIVHDTEPSSGRMADRPALVYALREIRAGAANGLVVARVRDLTTSFGDLVAFVEGIEQTGAFIASADRELDTSTGTGRATAHAIVELGSWERRPGTRRPRHDLATGRFKTAEHELGPCLAAMRARGIPLRAIADALNLARIPNPTGHAHWRPANVQAATRKEPQTRS